MKWQKTFIYFTLIMLFTTVSHLSKAGGAEESISCSMVKKRSVLLERLNYVSDIKSEILSVELYLRTGKDLTTKSKGRQYTINGERYYWETIIKTRKKDAPGGDVRVPSVYDACTGQRVVP